MIRPLFITDIPAATAFLMGVCAELERTYDAPSTASSLLRTMGQNHYMIVYEEGGLISGMAVLIIAPCFTNDKDIKAVEALWHSAPSLPPTKRARIMVELQKDMEAFCEDHGYRLYLCPNMQGKSNQLRFHLEKQGYRQIEGVYAKEAPWAI